MRVPVILAVLFSFVMVSQADLLVAYDFSGYAGDEARGTSTTVNVNMQDPAYIFRGLGVNANGNANRFNGNNWTETSLANAIIANDYFSCAISADVGYFFDVTNIVFNFQRSTTGGQDWALRSSADAFATDLDSWIALGNSTQTSDLSGAGLTGLAAIEFRMYGYNGTGGSGSAGYEGVGDDLIINGTTAVIPEPTTVAMLGAGLAALACFRRRYKS